MTSMHWNISVMLDDDAGSIWSGSSESDAKRAWADLMEDPGRCIYAELQERSDDFAHLRIVSKWEKVA